MAEKFKGSLPFLYMLALLLALRWTLVEPYVVPTGSMEPTLKPGDRLYALKCNYDVRLPFTEIILFRLRPVKRGDVILFRFPKEPSITYVKRAVGLPGDKVRVSDGTIYINGNPIEKTPTQERETMYDIESQDTKTLYIEKLGDVRHYVILDRKFDSSLELQQRIHRFHEEVTVPEGHYFAMGDNRDNSFDSRGWGFVPYENLKGKAMFIWFSSWDPNIQDPPLSLMAIPIYILNFGRFLFDVALGEAHIRKERIGTLIQ